MNKPSKLKPRKILSKMEIDDAVRAGLNFTVATRKEQRDVLSAASFAGVNLTTRKTDGIGWTVLFLNEAAKGAK